MSEASDIKVEVGTTISNGALLNGPTSSNPDGYLLPGTFPVGPQIAANFDLRPRHHDLLAIIPIHLAPTAIYLLRYVASLPTVDGGKFLLGLYVLFVDLADFYIPNIGQMTDLVIPLHVVIEARERIAKVYVATCTYLFMLCGKDAGYELGLQYDALIHARGRNTVFNTHRITLCTRTPDRLQACAHRRSRQSATDRARVILVPRDGRHYHPEARRSARTAARRSPRRDLLGNVQVRE